MRNRSLLTVIVALGFWLQGAVLQAEESAPSMYFPLAVGDHWIYEFSTSTDAPPVYESVSVIRQEDSIFFLWIKDDYMSGDILTGNGFQEAILRTSEGVGFSGRDAQNLETVDGKPQLFLKTPLTAGATWKNNWGKYEVTAVDVTEKVPGGTFKNCIEVTYKANSGDVTIVSLYAPGVGLIMRDETFIAIAFAGGGPVRSLLRLKDWKVQEATKGTTNSASAEPSS